MYFSLDKTQNQREAIYLLMASCLCFCFSVFRCYLTDSVFFLFLNWNLFLAMIPWAACKLISRIEVKKHRIKAGFLAAVWLFFLPNAPYIITDLFHIRFNTEMPIWFDLTMVLTFAWTGIIFGFRSLLIMEETVFVYFHRKVKTVLPAVSLFLCSFGIYLGRYLRWNTWDIITKPTVLAGDIFDRFIHPIDHPRTWGVTLIMGLFLNFMYYSFKQFNRWDKI